jgi:hypothetical protein
MKKSLALSVVLLLVSVLAVAAGTSGSWTGVINDSKCAADSAKKHEAACVAKCIAGGAKAVLVVGHDVFTITNADKIKGHEGHNVKVTGSLDKEKKEITVEKLEMASK